MIKITVRKYDSYADVKIIYNDTRIDLGFLDERERASLAESLQAAVDELHEIDLKNGY